MIERRDGYFSSLGMQNKPETDKQRKLTTGRCVQRHNKSGIIAIFFFFFYSARSESGRKRFSICKQHNQVTTADSVNSVILEIFCWQSDESRRLRNLPSPSPLIRSAKQGEVLLALSLGFN